ncbi:MAG: hypothetical protein ACYTF0_09540, partial [Planctomycetota bacterium]
EVVPGDGTIEAEGSQAVEVEVPRAAPFVSVRVTTNSPDLEVPSAMEPGAFTDAAQLEVAEVAIRGGQLRGAVRNGLAEDLNGVVLNLILNDLDGRELVSLEAPIGDLKAGAKQTFAVPTTISAEAAAGWSFAFSSAAGALEGDAGVSFEPFDLDGLVVAIDQMTATEAGLTVAVTATNNRPAALKGLQLTVDLVDSTGRAGQAVVTIGDLAPGAAQAGEAVASGLVDCDQIGISWASK